MRRVLAVATAALSLTLPAAAAAPTYTVTINSGVAGLRLGATYGSMRGRLGELVQDDWPLRNQVCKMFTNHTWLELCFNENTQQLEAIHAMQPLDTIGKTPRYCLSGVGYCIGNRGGVAALKRRFGYALRGPVHAADGSTAYSVVGPRGAAHRVETVFRVASKASRWAGQGRVFGAYMSFCGRQAKGDPPC
jgi:hypothetical protein